MAAKLHGYNNNVLLIASQAPWACQVAEYRAWQQLGRQVRVGEKGIAILAPCRYHTARHDSNEDSFEAPREVVRGFRGVHVFDISQTEGPAITQPAPPELLHGQAPVGLWDGLAAQIAAAGFTLERGDCGDANGRTSLGIRVVRVSADVDDAMAAKTACHELAHVFLHDGTEYASGCRGRAEVEAESVAYLVCDRAGLLTDSYTFAYIAGWSGGERDTVQATADRVMACARQIADTLALEPSRPT